MLLAQFIAKCTCTINLKGNTTSQSTIYTAIGTNYTLATIVARKF
ncbi:Hypothetical protein I595_1446 [Croceitalea dokdonensis DOKDO 023]|uniref:Uncharacterized protein n=1 Tax=Croceitalea dokdonensis DOKDO 023 TaxID=1300341 RepID=A0A0P7AHH6_9FLAO|nr:Hypothetical protein I595_1446 [Croceitalea dokdonensis DOKDO 023]